MERRETRKVFECDHEKCKKVVEKVLDHYKFEVDKLKMIDLFFFKGNSITKTCLEVGICRTTFFNWSNEILELTEKWMGVL